MAAGIDRGRVLLMLGRTADAIAEFESALKRHPNSASGMRFFVIECYGRNQKWSVAPDLIGCCYGRHRRPSGTLSLGCHGRRRRSVARSIRLLWPTPQAVALQILDCYGRHRRPLRFKCWIVMADTAGQCTLQAGCYGRHRGPVARSK